VSPIYTVTDMKCGKTVSPFRGIELPACEKIYVSASLVHIYHGAMKTYM